MTPRARRDSLGLRIAPPVELQVLFSSSSGSVARVARASVVIAGLTAGYRVAHGASVVMWVIVCVPAPLTGIYDPVETVLTFETHHGGAATQAELALTCIRIGVLEDLYIRD